jgi:hypothetical protein
MFANLSLHCYVNMIAADQCDAMRCEVWITLTHKEGKKVYSEHAEDYNDTCKLNEYKNDTICLYCTESRE